LGRIDGAGNVFIVGRKSRFVKVASNRVEPAEVEAVLRSHPMIRDGVVFALNAGTPDEAIAAIVATAAKLTVSDVVNYCAARLQPYKCPRRIEFRRSLPHNAHGKVIRHVFDIANEQSPA
jgi:acyl-coenzyme A synthetase/AMP-(fatty) acid ligase